MKVQEPLDKPLLKVSSIDESYKGKQIRLINDTSVYYKGLFALIFNILPGAILGLILVKLSLEHGKVALAEYNSQPGRYLESSYRKVKNGQTMAYMGLSIFFLEIIAFIVYTSI